MTFQTGDTVSVYFTDNMTRNIKIIELHPNGITGLNINLLNSKLTFFSFTNIISISKYQTT